MCGDFFFALCIIFIFGDIIGCDKFKKIANIAIKIAAYSCQNGEVNSRYFVIAIAVELGRTYVAIFYYLIFAYVMSFSILFKGYHDLAAVHLLYRPFYLIFFKVLRRPHTHIVCRSLLLFFNFLK